MGKGKDGAPASAASAAVEGEADREPFPLAAPTARAVLWPPKATAQAPTMVKYVVITGELPTVTVIPAASHGAESRRRRGVRH